MEYLDWMIEQAELDEQEDDDTCPICDGTGVFTIINMETQALRTVECGDCQGTGEKGS